MKKTKKLKPIKKPKKARLQEAVKSMPLPAVLEKPKSAEERVTEALENVPRITNETVGEHREEVLSSARKYIYPLQHSKHRIVRLSLGLLALVVVTFFVVSGLALYKFQATSTFMYDVTRIIPFPVAKTGGHWVSYESYLFELRRNMHYYHSQQQANFKTKDGKDQLKHLKQQAMDQVVMDSYIKQLAEGNGVSVSAQAVDQEVKLVRQQNRLGSNDRVFKDVLSEFWGWSEADFKHELGQQLLQQAVVARLDIAAQQKAKSALAQLRGGADFATVAAQVSEDVGTKASGGAYPVALTATNRDIPPRLTAAIFKLKPSDAPILVNTGYTLEIVKVTEVSGSSVKAAHIQFNLKPASDFVKPLQKAHPARHYIKF